MARRRIDSPTGGSSFLHALMLILCSDPICPDQLDAPERQGNALCSLQPLVSRAVCERHRVVSQQKKMGRHRLDPASWVVRMTQYNHICSMCGTPTIINNAVTLRRHKRDCSKTHR